MVSAKSILSEPYKSQVKIHRMIKEFIVLKGKDIHLESDNWNHKKSLYDILHYAKDGASKPIYLDMYILRHTSDDGLVGINLLIPHDKEAGEDEGFTNIGIDHTGFTYDGDVNFNEKRLNFGTLYKVDIYTGLRIMMQYGLTLITSEYLASFLTDAKDVDGKHIDRDCVISKIDNFYR